MNTAPDEVQAGERPNGQNKHYIEFIVNPVQLQKWKKNKKPHVIN